MPNMNNWRTDRHHEGYDVSAEPMLGLPIRTQLPDAYEPGYAYPLLVLFHGRGGNEEQVLRVAQKIFESAIDFDVLAQIDAACARRIARDVGQRPVNRDPLMGA